MTNKRKSISTRRRFEILKRDNFTCQYCSAKPPKVPLEIDHLIPVSKGGTNSSDNLITACFECNRGKSNIELTNVPEGLHTIMERKKVAISQYKQYQKVLKQERKIIEDELNMVIESFESMYEHDTLSSSTFASIKKFIKQLGVDEVVDSMEITGGRIHNSRYAFKYFCGVCWGKIKDTH